MKHRNRRNATTKRQACRRPQQRTHITTQRQHSLSHHITPLAREDKQQQGGQRDWSPFWAARIGCRGAIFEIYATGEVQTARLVAEIYIVEHSLGLRRRQ